MNKKISKAAAAKLLLSQNRIMIIGHSNPDGDALGSCFALYHALSALGKRVCVVNSDKITPKYCFLSGGKSILKPQFQPDFVVSVDVGTPKLFGASLMEYADKVDLNIDHHPSNPYFGKYNVVDAKAAAAGEIMLDIIEAMKVDIDGDIASALYTAISTDTACFMHNSTTATTLRKAAKLVDLGADINYLNTHLFVKKSWEQFELESAAVKSVRFFRKKTIAVMVISLALMEQTGADADDTDGIATLPRKIEGVDVGITMREVSPNVYKISARSDGNVNVSEVCQRLGGGGHVRAAGCTLEGDVDSVVKRIVDEVMVEYHSIEEVV